MAGSAIESPWGQLVDGYSYKETAAKLNMSSGQVNNVVAAIYRKLGVHSKVGLSTLVH